MEKKIPFLLVLLIVLLAGCPNIVNDDPGNLTQDPTPTTTPTVEPDYYSGSYKVGDGFTLGSDSQSIDFMWVPAGSFSRGGSTVTISKGFWVSRFEISKSQWRAYGVPLDDVSRSTPVEGITWSDAQAFITAFNTAYNCSAALPTEAQWEWAAMGAIASKGYKYAGSDNLEEVAWCYANADNSTHVIGQKKPNELGLYDMSGNVAEWCSDWFAPYMDGTQTDPTGPDSGSLRVIRGGDWQSGLDSNETYGVSHRRSHDPDSGALSIGLRIVIPGDLDLLSIPLEVPYSVSPGFGSQDNRIIDTTPGFSWSSSSGAIGYNFQLSKYSGFNEVTVDVDSGITSSYSLPREQALSVGSTYYWRVRARGSGDRFSSWSSVRSFSVVSPMLKNVTPNCRVLQNDRYTLTWDSHISNYSTMALQHYTHITDFELQVAFSESELENSSIISVPPSDDYVTATTYELSINTSVGDKVFWRLRALSDDGMPGPWTDTASFEIVDITPINTNTIGTGNGAIDFVYVPPGTFQMGMDVSDLPYVSDEVKSTVTPIHEVTLTKGFWMSKYVVTEAQWLAYMDDNDTNSSNKPVIKSWDDAQSFITAFNTVNDSNTSLPTEAQWEWAGRGATVSRNFLYTGSDNIFEAGWKYEYPYVTPRYFDSYKDESALRFSGLQEVGKKLPNELGLYDMSGNSAEWCRDWYGPYSSDAQTDPTGPETGASRVVRSQWYYSTDFFVHRPGYRETNASLSGIRLVIPAE